MNIHTVSPTSFAYWNILIGLATMVSATMHVVTGKKSAGEGMESSSSSCIDFQKEAYGNGDYPQQQVAQVMVTDDQKENKTLPLVIFVHGGAWGSGFPTMYRLIAAPFLPKNYRVVVLGYRTYPDATIDEQMQDVESALSYFTKKYISSSSNDDDDTTTDTVPAPVVLIGHSSGAHVALMVALKKGKCHDDVPTPPLVNAFIGMSGVYDLELARQYEVEQGLTELSPMGPVCHEKLQENSPTRIIGNRSNGNTDARIVSTLPPILLLHGAEDTVAPAIQSKMLYKAVQDAYQHTVVTKQATCCCQLEILAGVQHQDTVLETCIGYGKTQHTLFQWLDETLQ